MAGFRSRDDPSLPTVYKLFIINFVGKGKEKQLSDKSVWSDLCKGLREYTCSSLVEVFPGVSVDLVRRRDGRFVFMTKRRKDLPRKLKRMLGFRRVDPIFRVTKKGK